MRSWSELCVELLELIVKQLWAIEDIVRFRAVCRLWRSVPIKNQQFSPCLMLAEGEYNYHSFYSPLTQKVYRLNLPELRGRRCWTSSGWLITSVVREVCLLNPFSNEKIYLPALPMEPDEFHPVVGHQLFIKKIILSSSPRTTPLEDDDEEKSVVMVLTTRLNVLTFLRMGDKVWTVIRIHKFINDVIYFHRQFYAITSSAELLMVDISGPQPKTIEIAEGMEHSDLNPFPLSCYYLVESAGELFLLARYLSITMAYVTGFGVSKFHFDYRMWTQVRSLDNCAMFVGPYTSFSIFPSKKFEWQPNCIYFTNDNQPGSTEKNDIGVFRLDTQGIQDYFNCRGIFCYVCAALWVQPSL